MQPGVVAAARIQPIRLTAAALCLLAGLCSVGCDTGFGPKAEHGITFYCPGAGNIDFGDRGIREGLERAGYSGQVATLTWTISFNPAIDQTLRLNAHIGSMRLARLIERYIDEYPGRQVNVIGLSAGSGVAVWALEKLKPEYKVDTLVLLSSSLYHRYDVSKAAKAVRGPIYNYHSSQDPILAGPMKIFGTIDGVFLEDGAGAVGLHPPRNPERVINIPWRPEYRKYGYSGGHTDVTSPAFVQAAIARHILTTATPAGDAPITYATAPERRPPAAPPR